MNRLFNYVFKDTFDDLNPEQTFDRKIPIVIVTCSLCLVGIYYGSNRYFLSKILSLFGVENPAQFWINAGSHFSNDRIFFLTHWSVVTVFFEVAVPIFVIVFIIKEPLSNYGLRIKGAFSSSVIYLILLIGVVPIIAAASFLDSFQSRYPIYDPAGEDLWPNFILWEFMYMFRFFGVEFLFRGFLIHGIKHRFGFYSIFVMIIPYCMVHFGKPFPETIASIVAGIILGALSLRTNSIWQGVVIHCCVGLEMDLLGLWHKGYFS